MKNVDVSLFKAQATFNLKPGKELEPEVLRKAVVDAGFTPRDIFSTTTGKLIDENGQLAFQPQSSSQVFALAENDELIKLKSEGLPKVGLVAKVVGEKSPLSLEIQKYDR